LQLAGQSVVTLAFPVTRKGSGGWEGS